MALRHCTWFLVTGLLKLNCSLLIGPVNVLHVASCGVKWVKGSKNIAMNFCLHVGLYLASHLDSGRRCRCRDLPLHPSGVVAGSRADGGPQKAGCWPLKPARLEKTLPSCRRSSDCGSLFRSAEVFRPLHLNLQSGNTISFDSIYRPLCIHIWDCNNILSHFKHQLTDH